MQRFKGPVIIYRRGAEDLGLNEANLANPPFECYFTEAIPPPPRSSSSDGLLSPLITFDDFRDPPHMSSFFKQI